MGIKLKSIGDLSFHGRLSESPDIGVFSDVIALLSDSDLTIANLENPLIEVGQPVPGKCTLKSSVKWADVLRKTGIHLVTLANNHIMDYGSEGLLSTIRVLQNAGILCVGAGENIEEANSPLILEIKNNKIAILARTAVLVSSPSYAGIDSPGTAFLNIEQTIQQIKSLKRDVDYVVLLIHWGVEEYGYPSPEQRKTAKRFVEAGADLIFGHHPHVVQGIEKIKHGIVSYSSGNFIFDEFFWEFVNGEGNIQQTYSSMSELNRHGMILETDIDKSIISWSCVHTRINESGCVVIDNSIERKHRFDMLCRRLFYRNYPLFWRFYAFVRETDLRIIPLVRGKLTWSKIKKIRPSHFRQLADTLKRSLKITSEKSTNPYE